MNRKLFSLFLLLSVAVNAKTSKIIDSLNIAIKFYQKIKLSDGIKLSSNIYFPENYKEGQKLPTILIITPYVSDENHERGLFFARNGYIFMTVDCRGRGNSEGTFFPFEDDAKDGAEVIDWIGNQKWSNGKVGMMGGSYRGMNQWFVLKKFPKNLTTIVPTASVGPGLDFPKYNNIFYPYVMRWLMLTSGKTINQKLFGVDFWKLKQEQLYKENAVFNSYDSLVGYPKEAFQKWISHPSHDSFWQQFYFNADEAKKINIPILSITGHFDSDQPGAMKYYTDHMKNGNNAAKLNHYLIVGPWSHGGTRRPQKELGGFKFKDNAVLNINSLHLDWFNWTLKEGKKPTFLKDRVAYYTMGTSKWQYEPKLKNIANSSKTYFLNSVNSDAKNLFYSGNLSEKLVEKDKEPDIIIYDPLKNKGTKDASYLSKNRDFFKDQSYVNNKEVLMYHSEPLSKDVQINGKISFEAYISLNVVDTDFQVAIYEITNNNESIFLQTDQLRARYRKGLEKPELVKKGAIEKYIFKGENMFSRTIKKGSKLRLIFSAIDSPGVQKNYNYEEDPAIQSPLKAKTAVIKLYHNKKYPSKIILPIKE
ncbi:CocE/NonD family hydrolase [Tenacibaculum sp. M341]|uniref:CocE/NonD family hydrolase n=1 Tax=Tenacibaculum sp. M341 TaxID=2530339 RepID=UPI0010492097|nr:CocE/NonD family hydrolase [Tenacibaculum sp. M341]TCI91897.1 CocE/NonD family hydrolase [Tenacibaculum sp. M341]